MAPAELEALLLTCEAILDVAVAGIPDDKSGEVPKAYVVKQKGHEDLSEADVKAFVKGKVAAYKELAQVRTPEPDLTRFPVRGQVSGLQSSQTSGDSPEVTCAIARRWSFLRRSQSRLPARSCARICVQWRQSAKETSKLRCQTGMCTVPWCSAHGASRFWFV